MKDNIRSILKTGILSLILTTNFFTIMAQDGDGRFDVFVDDLKEAQADANIFTSTKERTYFIRPALEMWLHRAVSKVARDEWLMTTSFSSDQRKKIDQALTTLAGTASKKLPSFKPGAEKFAFGTKEEIQLMKDKITDISSLTVYKIGLEDQHWRIDKDEYGMPTGRRKWGYVWFRSNSKIMDHPYCRVFQMYIYQPYLGGGTYGESYGSYESRWLCGCP